jgi:peroxiredoxin
MAQLRLGYAQIQKYDAEIVQITHNTLEEARRYGRFYTFDFPYLCDPDRVVHERYGLPLDAAHVGEIARSMTTAATDLVLRGERTPLPVPFMTRYGFKDSPQAVFVIDRRGIVRSVHRLGPNAGLPTTATLAKELSAID